MEEINVKFCTHVHVMFTLHTLNSSVCNSLASSCLRFIYGELVTNSTDCCLWFGKQFSFCLYSCYYLIGLVLNVWIEPFLLCLGSWIFRRVWISVSYQVSHCWRFEVHSGFFFILFSFFKIFFCKSILSDSTFKLMFWLNIYLKFEI